MADEETGLATSDSPADDNITQDVNEASSTSTDGNEESSTSSEPKSLNDALEQGLKALSGDKEGGESEQQKNGEGEAAEVDVEKEGKAENPDDKKAEDGKADENELYQMPEGLSTKGQERFQKLVELNKEKDTILQQHEERVQTLEQDHADFQEVIKFSGATPEEFEQLMQYSNKLKNGDLEGAFEILESQYKSLALSLGKSDAGVDLLEGFDDLKEAVDSLHITEKHAIELANARRSKMSADAAAAKQQASDAQTQHADPVATAQQNIVALVNGWKGKDIDFDVKYPTLMKKAKEISSKYAPENWEQALTDFYEGMSVPKTEAPVKKTNQPLRPGGGGAKNRTPTSMAEALELGLGKGA